MRKNSNIKEQRNGAKTHCPECMSDDLKKSTIKGNVNPRSEGNNWSPDVLSCNKCGCEFTIWRYK